MVSRRRAFLQRAVGSVEGETVIDGERERDREKEVTRVRAKGRTSTRPRRLCFSAPYAVRSACVCHPETPETALQSAADRTDRDSPASLSRQCAETKMRRLLCLLTVAGAVFVAAEDRAEVEIRASGACSPSSFFLLHLTSSHLHSHPSNKVCSCSLPE